MCQKKINEEMIWLTDWSIGWLLRWSGVEREGAAGRRTDVSLSVLLLHGQRDQLPAQAVPGRHRLAARPITHWRQARLPRALLGSLRSTHQRKQLADAAHEQRSALLHRGLSRPQSLLRHLEHAAAAPVAVPRYDPDCVCSTPIQYTPLSAPVQRDEKLSSVFFVKFQSLRNLAARMLQ